MRFQVLAGKHYQKERFVRDGQEIEAEFEYSANDPTCNIVDTGKGVNGPIDLEARYNQRGFSEKFRRMLDVQDEIKSFDDDAFLQEAKRRGLLKDGAVVPQQTTAPTKFDESKTVASVTIQPSKPHPALANLGKMPMVGMQKLAEDEEIDLSGCKGEQDVRKVIEAALKARK